MFGLNPQAWLREFQRENRALIRVAAIAAPQPIELPKLAPMPELACC